MKLALLSTALLALVPAAQAQTWTQLLSTPGADVSLPAASAPAPALGPDGTGMIFVQTYNRNGLASPSISVHALGNDGLLQPGLEARLTPTAGLSVFSPLGITTRHGHRTAVINYGRPDLFGAYFYPYHPGETQRPSAFAFQHGAVVSRIVADGNGNTYATRLLPDLLPERPTLHYFGNGQFHFGRYYGGCASGEHLPIALLDADIPVDGSGPITAVTRCVDPSSPGKIALTEFDPQTGARLSVRRSWPYADSAAPVVAAFALGAGRFLIEQADASSGERIARIISRDGEGTPLALPSGFQLRRALRQADFTLVIADEPVRGQVGALYLSADGKRADWLDYGELPLLGNLDVAWAADSNGNAAVAYRDPQAGDAVRIYELDSDGRVVARRTLTGYGARAGARVELGHEPVGNAIVLAADVVLPDGRDAVHLEQFQLSTDNGTIPVGGIGLPLQP